MMESIFNIYYEDLWNPGSALYLPAMLRREHGSGSNRVGPFDPLTLTLAKDWARRVDVLSATSSLVEALMCLRIGRLRITGLSTIRQAGRPLFVSGLSRIVFPLCVDRLVVRCFAESKGRERLRLVARDFTFFLVVGLKPGTGTLIRLREFHPGPGAWYVKRRGFQGVNRYSFGEELSAEDVRQAAQIFNQELILQSGESSLNSLAQAVLNRGL